jgi:hypothetical protein
MARVTEPGQYSSSTFPDLIAYRQGMTARGPRRPAGGVGGRAYDDLTFVVMKDN